MRYFLKWTILPVFACFAFVLSVSNALAKQGINQTAAVYFLNFNGDKFGTAYKVEDLNLEAELAGQDAVPSASHGQSEEEIFAYNWLSLSQNGNIFAQTRIFTENDCSIGRYSIEGEPFYLVRSSKGNPPEGGVTGALLSPGGLSIQIFNGSCLLQMNMGKDNGKSKFKVLDRQYNYSHFGEVGKNSLSIRSKDGEESWKWTDMRAVRAEYTGQKSAGDDAFCYRFKLLNENNEETGEELALMAFRWQWLNCYQGQPLLLTIGNLEYDAGGSSGSGLFLHDAIPLVQK